MIPKSTAMLAWCVLWLLLLLSRESHGLATPTPTATTTNPIHRHCVVVGGGPVGLAAALTLSNPPHSYNVTLLEQSQGATSVQTYDPTRAYLYLVNPRGLEWFDGQNATNPQALQRLMEYGSVSSALDSITVPADPNEPIDTQTGKGSAMANLTLSTDRRLRSVWVPRHQMIQLLVQTCQDQNQDRQQAGDDSVGHVTIVNGQQVESLEESSDVDGVQIRCQDGTCYNASLVVAADGIDSMVRQSLAKPAPSVASSSWLFQNPRDFQVRKYPSASAGLKLKCLQFPPNFTLVNTDGSMVPTQSTTIYTMRSTNTGAERLALGLLPVKDPTLIRPANINTRPTHKIWSIHDGPTMKEYMSKSFPRLPWDTIIDNDAEWERFAQAKGTTYPQPQYSPGSAVVHPTNPHVGVVLVGDACHAFPPDTGQGINSGLNDVVALDRCLRGQDILTGEPVDEKTESHAAVMTLKDALQRYQANRRPEHHALIRLARFGAPYQYRQSARGDRLGAALWMWNAALRQILNKVTRGFVPPVAIVTLFQTPPLGTYYIPYRQIMRKADATSTILTASFGLSLLWMGVKLLCLRATM